MVKTRTLQDGFSGGEFDPSMHGAIRNGLYSRSAKRIENFIPSPQGPVSFRSGFNYHMNTRGGAEAYFIKFEYSETEQYLLELTGFNLRVHKYGSLGIPQIIYSTSGILDSISIALECVITDNAHGLANGDAIHFVGINITKLNGPTFTVSDVTANTFKIKDERTGAYISTIGETYVADFPNHRWNKILDINSPWASYDDIRRVKFAQFGNNIYIVHNSFKPRLITRVTDTNWTVNTYTPTADPFLTVNDYPAAVIVYENRLFFGGVLAQPQKIFTTVSGDLNDMTVGVGATDAMTFTLGSSKNNSILWFMANEKVLSAGTLGGMQKIFGATENEAITPTSINNRVLAETEASSLSPILVDGRIVFAEKGSRRVRALNFDEAREGYEALDLNLVSSHIGNSQFIDIDFQKENPDNLWLTRNDGVMVGCSINLRENIYGWHRHTTQGKFVSVRSMNSPNGTEKLWVCTKRSFQGSEYHTIEVEAPGVTFPNFDDFYTGEDNKESDEQLYFGEMFEAQKLSVHLDSSKIYDGLFPREFPQSGLDNNSIVLSALTGNAVTVTASGASFKAEDIGREIWGAAGIGRGIITAFTSNTVVTIKVTSDFLNLTYIQRGWYLTTNEMWGLHHLEGEEVYVLVDGEYHEPQTVVNGRINLNSQSSYAQVGLTYKGVVKTLNIEIQGINGPTTAKKKNVNKIGIKFYNSTGVKFGTDRYSMNLKYWREAWHVLNRPAPLFTGEEELKLDSSWATSLEIVVAQENPLPCTLQLIIPQVTVGAA